MEAAGKDIFILGGPNGAGKTTAARVLLPDYYKLRTFLNADEIAREISPANVEVAALAAGRRMLERMRECVRHNVSFAIETTCAGRSYVSILKACKASDWRIALYYLWLPTPEDAIARVGIRVAQGGHGIPVDVIRRRYRIGIWNMRNLYLPLADTAAIYDNSGETRILIAEKESGASLRIVDPERWRRMEELGIWK